MTEEELSEIEARANAATPGPWTTEKPVPHDDGWARGVVVAATYGQPVFAKNGNLTRSLKSQERVYADPPGGSMPAADQRFIAAARADVPNLLAEVRRLRADLSAHPKRFNHDAVQELSEWTSQCLEMFEHDDPATEEYAVAWNTREAIESVKLSVSDSVSLQTPRYSTEAVDALLKASERIDIEGPIDAGRKFYAAVEAVRASRVPR